MTHLLLKKVLAFFLFLTVLTNVFQPYLIELIGKLCLFSNFLLYLIDFWGITILHFE